MIPRRLLVAAVAAALGAALGCDHGAAPLCRSDADCATGQRCSTVTGICVGFETPLLPAPDAGTDATSDAASDAATDGGTTD